MMAAPRKIRIADVAAHAGVGVGTVSRVLSRSPHVSDSTRQRVLEAIEATEYRPGRLDRQVHMLAAGRRAAGLVLISLRLSTGQLAGLAGAGVPVAGVDAAARGVPHTVVDGVRGAMMATRHLLGLGHRSSTTLTRQRNGACRRSGSRCGKAGPAVRWGRLLRGEAVRPPREVLPLQLIVRGSTTAACGRRTADRAFPAQPEPAGARSRLPSRGSCKWK